MSVTFSPGALGTRTGVLTLTDNTISSPHVIALTGVGAAATIRLSPLSLTFGNQTVGTTSAKQIITLTNRATVSLNIASIAASGDFSATNMCGAVVPPAENCTISVSFTPTLAGARTGAITISDDAPGSPHRVTLTGTGLGPQVSLSVYGLGFNVTSVNSTSPTQTVTLSNTGTAPLLINSIVVVGDFVQTNDCGTTVAIGASCTLSVTFKPADIGGRGGSITITDNDNGLSGSTQVLLLSGFASGPVASLSSGGPPVRHTSARVHECVPDSDAEQHRQRGAGH